MQQDLTQFFKRWIVTILSPCITTLLYFLIFGLFLGKHIKAMQGVNYVTFITPGLIMMVIISRAYASTALSFFTMCFKRSIEEVLVSPLSDDGMLIAFILAGIIKALFLSLLLAGLLIPFAHITIHSVCLPLLSVFIVATLLALLGFINALLATNFENINLILTFIILSFHFYCLVLVGLVF